MATTCTTHAWPWMLKPAEIAGHCAWQPIDNSRVSMVMSRREGSQARTARQTEQCHVLLCADNQCSPVGVNSCCKVAATLSKGTNVRAICYVRGVCGLRLILRRVPCDAIFARQRKHSWMFAAHQCDDLTRLHFRYQLCDVMLPRCSSLDAILVCRPEHQW